jgi:type IV pilus assembly protein PilV
MTSFLSTRRFTAARMAGVSLLEALMALLVVSLGLLALLGLLTTAARLGKTGQSRALANLLAQDITDRMRANPAAAREGDYELPTVALAQSRPPAAPPCAASGACTPQELAQHDLAFWQAVLFNNLPAGTGHVRPGEGAADVWIVWRDPSGRADGADLRPFLTGQGDERSACPPGFQTHDPVPTCLYFRVAP